MVLLLITLFFSVAKALSSAVRALDDSFSVKMYARGKLIPSGLKFRLAFRTNIGS